MGKGSTQQDLRQPSAEVGDPPTIADAGPSPFPDLLAAVGAAAASLCVFLVTLQPEVGGSGDSRMFQVLAAVPGTSHYPTHLMVLDLLKLALPFVDPAVRANLLSAVAGAGSCGVMTLLLRRLGARRAAAVGASLAFAWTAIPWVLSIYAEVYTLHLLMLLTAVLLLLRWQSSRRRLPLATALLVAALGFGTHSTMVLAIPGMLVFLCWVDRTVLGRGWFVGVVICAALFGLLPYGLLVSRTFDPDVAFLGSAAGDLGQLIDVLLGGGNRANLFQQPLASMMTERLPLMAATFARQLHLLLPLAAVGVWRRPTPADALLLVTLVCNLLLLLYYSVPDLEVFYLPGLAILALYAGRGLEKVLRRLRTPPTLALAVAVAMPSLFLVSNWNPVVRARDTTTGAWIGRVLDSTPDRCLIVALDWDTATALAYATEVEREGSDDRQVLFYPWRALTTVFGFERVRRHLCGGPPLRVQPRGRIATPTGPVFVAENRPTMIDRLRGLGYDLRPVEQGVYELGPVDCQPPPLPAVLLVHQVESRPSLNAAIASVTAADFDPRRRVVVLGRRAGIEPLGQNPPPGAVEITRWWQSQIAIEVESATPGWLVITDVVPGFWRAWIDGEGVATCDANVIHRGIPVPRGRHLVVLSDPAGAFRLGEWFTGRPSPLQH